MGQGSRGRPLAEPGASVHAQPAARPVSGLLARRRLHAILPCAPRDAGCGIAARVAQLLRPGRPLFHVAFRAVLTTGWFPPAKPAMNSDREPAADLVRQSVETWQRIPIGDKQAAAMVRELRSYAAMTEEARAALSPSDQPADFAKVLA